MLRQEEDWYVGSLMGIEGEVLTKISQLPQSPTARYHSNNHTNGIIKDKKKLTVWK